MDLKMQTENKYTIIKLISFKYRLLNCIQKYEYASLNKDMKIIYVRNIQVSSGETLYILKK